MAIFSWSSSSARGVTLMLAHAIDSKSFAMGIGIDQSYVYWAGRDALVRIESRRLFLADPGQADIRRFAKSPPDQIMPRMAGTNGGARALLPTTPALRAGSSASGVG